MESASKRVFIKNNEQQIMDLVHGFITELAHELANQGYAEVDLTLEKGIKPGVANQVAKVLGEKLHELGWDVDLTLDTKMTRIKGTIS